MPGEMSKWAEASGYLDQLWSDSQGKLTIDQRLRIAQTMALLSIAQELNRIHHEGINSEYIGG